MTTGLDLDTAEGIEYPEGFKEVDDQEDDNNPVKECFDLGIHGNILVDQVEDDAGHNKDDDDC
jgi:hypothetical protein